MTNQRTMSKPAAQEISELLIDREQKLRTAQMWDTDEAGDETNERYFWLWKCEAELEALRIEETLRDKFGIVLREFRWTPLASITLEDEIELLTRCVNEAKRSRVA